CDSHFFHQPVLQRLEQPLDAPFRLRRVRCDPLDVQFRQSAAELRARRSVVQLLLPLHRPGSHKQAVFIGVERQRPPVALQPSTQGAKIFFTGIVLHETAPGPAGGVVDHRDQVAGGTAILQPVERRAVHHHQFAERGTTRAPHVHQLHSPATCLPQSSSTHPLPQGLPAHTQPVLRQMLGRERRTETQIRRQPQPSQTALLEVCGNLAIRGTSPQPVYQPAISHLAKTLQQPPHLPIAQPQTAGRFDLQQMPLLDFVQNLQSLPLFRAQLDPLLFHRAPRPLEKRTFLLCTNRTFSRCSYTKISPIDFACGRSLTSPPRSQRSRRILLTTHDRPNARSLPRYLENRCGRDGRCVSSAR